MIYLILTIVCLVIAGIGKAIMDTLQFHFSTSVFKHLDKNYWWNPAISWKNKWKNHDPKQGEAFPGSSTIFVFVTDAWHFFQFIFLRFFFACIILFMIYGGLVIFGLMWVDWIIQYVGLSVIFGLTFTLFYSKILK